MSFEAPLFKPPGFTAGADLSAVQFRFVKLNGTDLQVVQATVAGEDTLGVQQNNPSAVGQSVSVMTAGVSKVEAGASVSIGDLITTDTVGRAIAATTGRTNTADGGAANDPLIGSFVAGTALEAASGSGVLIAVLLDKQGAVPQTVA